MWSCGRSIPDKRTVPLSLKVGGYSGDGLRGNVRGWIQRCQSEFRECLVPRFAGLLIHCSLKCGAEPLASAGYIPGWPVGASRSWTWPRIGIRGGGSLLLVARGQDREQGKRGGKFLDHWDFIPREADECHCFLRLREIPQASPEPAFARFFPAVPGTAFRRSLIESPAGAEDRFSVHSGFQIPQAP